MSMSPASDLRNYSVLPLEVELAQVWHTVKEKKKKAYQVARSIRCEIVTPLLHQLYPKCHEPVVLCERDLDPCHPVFPP